MTVKAAGYIRVSTGRQALEGYSLAAQEQAIRAYCQAYQWELVDLYIDGGRSGRKMEGRDEMARLLSDAAAGRFQRVVIAQLDRMARKLRDSLEIYDRLEGEETFVVSIKEAIDTSTPMGRMLRSILGALAEWEVDTITERIKTGLEEKARQGELLGPLPLGYLRDESGDIALDPATAPLIREAFVMYSSGDYSLREMTQWASRSGLRSVNGRLLDRMNIRKLLTNATFTGKVSFHARRGGGFVAEGKHPAIVEPELFDVVQDTLARRRYKKPERPYGKEPYPLSTVATCGSCEAGLSGCASVKEGRYRYRYYRCSTAQRRGRAACRQPMVQADVFEDQIAAYVGGMRLPPEYLGEIMDELRVRRRSGSIDRSEIERAQRAKDRWHRLFAMGEVDEATLKREIEPLKQVLTMDDRPKEAFDVEEAVGYLRRVGELWSESPRAQQREFVREVFERIIVQGREVTALTPKLAYAPLFVLDRRERFGDMGRNSCHVAPRAGLEPTT